MIRLRSTQNPLTIFASLLLIFALPLCADESSAYAATTVDTTAAQPAQSIATQPVEKKKCCGEKRREKKEKAREKKRQKQEAAQQKKDAGKKKQEDKSPVRKKAKKHRTERKPTEDIIEELYVGVTGYNIPKEEVETIKAKGGAPTYGEIKYQSLKTIFDDLPKSHKRGAFYDFGSGVGKVVVQAYLDVPQFKKTVGWEISQQRYNDAQYIVSQLKKRELTDKNRDIEFRIGDFLEADIDDARVIYMCSTCYSEECMAQLTSKFSKLKKGLIVITLKPLPNYKEYGFELKREYKLPMTWWHASPVYVYELKLPVKVAKAKQEKKPKKSKTTKKSKKDNK